MVLIPGRRDLRELVRMYINKDEVVADDEGVIATMTMLMLMMIMMMMMMMTMMTMRLYPLRPQAPAGQPSVPETGTRPQLYTNLTRSSPQVLPMGLSIGGAGSK